MTTSEKPEQTVLIVDDEPINLKILKAHLQSAGYRICEASSGLEALAMSEDNPDLILLDIMMPVMDGFETCQRLKANERTRDIPVIFISALHDTKSKVYGLNMGGVDYVSKPFEASELLARVRTHLTIRRQDLQIKSYATQLEQMVEERTRQLIHADRLATLGTFSAAIVHEINNPNTYIGGNAGLIRLLWERMRPIVERHTDEDDSGHVAKSLEKIDQMLESILEGSRRITRIVNGLKNYSRQCGTQKGRYRLVDPVKDALNLIGYRLKRGVTVETDIPQNIELWCDPQKISQIFVNLLNNSIDAMEDTRGAITIRAFVEADRVLIQFKDKGPGIPDEFAQKAFDPFFTTKPQERGTGLGLFIVRSIMEEHEGEISILPFAGEGAEFRLVLPLAQQQCGASDVSGGCP